MAGTHMFAPTHIVPAGGLPTWANPDTPAPGAALDAGLEVEVTETRDDWARVVCSNGWAAWVDGRRLNQLARSSPVWAELDAALAAMHQLLRDLESGRVDESAYRNRMFH